MIVSQVIMKYGAYNLARVLVCDKNANNGGIFPVQR
jgi:hypothetical protein